MTTREAIQCLAQQLDQELVVGTTGFTNRDLQAASDRPENFYMIGSMGLAASFGMGVALQQPDRQVVVFDGDGAALMGLGNLPMAGAIAPTNYFHIIFDNEAFVSTGGQPTYSDRIALDAVAEVCGYAQVEKVSSEQALCDAWEGMKGKAGPGLLLIKCERDHGDPEPRVAYGPEEITERFMGAIHGTDSNQES